MPLFVSSNHLVEPNKLRASFYNRLVLFVFRSTSHVYDSGKNTPDESRRHGGAFGGLSPPRKASSPPELKNTIKHWSFCQILECQAPLHKRKAPLPFKAFWRRY